MEHREAVEEWRQRQRNPSSLNNPDHVWRGFQKSAYWQDRRDDRRPSRLDVAKVELAIARAHIDELETANERQREEIERLQDGLEAERRHSAELERLIERQRAEIERLRMQRPRGLTRSYRSKTG
jgi:chromosome segregation ATPase